LRKKEDFIEEEETIQEKSSDSLKINRKEEKRLEAEKRKKENLATKDLKKNIELFETKIDELEKLKSKLEHDLTKEEIYSNPILAKQNKLEYDKVKIELEKNYTNWTNAQEELELILHELSNT
jgi:ATP-binding cassette subfamily F protein 3